MKNMWEVYDALIDSLPEAGSVRRSYKNLRWTLTETDTGLSGLAMSVPWTQRPAAFPSGLEGLGVREAAPTVRSWNLAEASAGMSAINAAYNTSARLRELAGAEPYENHCTRGLDFRGKVVGIVGHLSLPEPARSVAGEVYVMEREPQSGDYPDSACDFILPRCDIVMVTGCTFVNKTLPHILELTKNAYTILTGPTVPMCPALLDCGIDRLAGLIVTDSAGIREHVTADRRGSPYGFGETFLLAKEERSNRQ